MFGYTFDFGELGNKLLAVVNVVFLVLSILGIVNDPTTQSLSDSKLAMSYLTPKKKDADINTSTSENSADLKSTTANGTPEKEDTDVKESSVESKLPMNNKTSKK